MDDIELKEVTIYTDGACINNPGPGGYGVVLQYGRHQKEISDGFRLTTNNRMEIMAAIVALEALKTKCKVTLYTDSQLLANSYEEGWINKWKKKGWKRGKKPILNADLWQKFDELTHVHELKIVWVKGHAGNPGNERADSLSMQAALHKSSNIDSTYEEGNTQTKLPSMFSLFGNPSSTTTTEPTTTVELDGVKYNWDGQSWYGEDYLKPSEYIIHKLNQELSNQLSQEDQQITDIHVLIQRAKNARANLQHICAEELAYRILELDPENHSGIAILCASLRDRGLPHQALKATDAFHSTDNLALLTSRAAAYCDIEMWEDAKQIISRALAIQESEEAFSVVKRIKAARPDLYQSKKRS